MERSKVGAREAAEQLSRLRAGKFTLAPEPLGCLGENGILQLDVETSAGDGEALEGAVQPEAAEVADQVLDKADLREILAAHEDCEVSRPTGFFVSVTRGGLCRFFVGLSSSSFVKSKVPPPCIVFAFSKKRQVCCTSCFCLLVA